MVICDYQSYGGIKVYDLETLTATFVLKLAFSGFVGAGGILLHIHVQCNLSKPDLV